MERSRLECVLQDVLDALVGAFAGWTVGYQMGFSLSLPVYIDAAAGLSLWRWPRWYSFSARAEASPTPWMKEFVGASGRDSVILSDLVTLVALLDGLRRKSRKALPE